MSLADLKKKVAGKNLKKLDVDEFIEDATAYAQGHSILTQPTLPAKKRKQNARARNFKNATFTLSHEHIEQLNHLAEHTGFAKSRILRLLIEQLADHNDEDIDALLTTLKKTSSNKTDN